MKQIKEMRAERGVTQVGLAAAAGMDPATLNRIEQGKANPNVKTLERLADALEVEVGDFFPKAQAPLPLDEATGDPWITFINEYATDLEEWAYAFHRGEDPAGLPEREFLAFVGGVSVAKATFDRLQPMIETAALENQDENLARAWRRLSRSLGSTVTPGVERRAGELERGELPDNVVDLQSRKTA